VVKHLFKHEIKIYETVTRNEYNEETFSEGEYYDGRFQLTNELLTNPEGEQEQVDAIAYIDKEANILSIGTKITYNNQDYRVVGLKENINDIADNEFYKVWLQIWEA